MLYQLPNGRTIEISIEEYLSLSDEELKSLNGYTDLGDYICNPMHGSVINRPQRDYDDEFYTNLDVPDVPSEEKIKDQDYTPDDE